MIHQISAGHLTQDKIEEIILNGYQLTLGPCTNSIPVSRSYVPQLKSFIA